MRHLVRLSAFVLAAVIVAAPASAQYGGRRPSRQDASLDVPHVATGVAALAVRYGGDLQLSQKQLDAIEVIRQHQDSVRAPLLRALDSLRNGPRPVNPLDLSQEQREALAARRDAVKAAMDAVHQSNDDARRQVMAVLTVDQQTKAASLENDAQKVARAQGERRESDGWYGGRSRMGQGVPRPPQG